MRWGRLAGDTRAAAGREWRHLRRSPWDLAMIALAPALVFAILMATFSARVPERLPVVVIDRDATPLSRQLTRWLAAAPALDVRQGPASRDEGLSEVRAGRAYALVEIGSGFARSLRRAEASPVVVSLNGQASSAASSIGRAVQTVLGTLSAGVAIRAAVARGAAPEQALGRTLPIRSDLRFLGNGGLDMARYLGTSLWLAALQILAMAAGASAAGRELSRGTAGEWVASAGGRFVPALLGKVLVTAAPLLAAAVLAAAWLAGPIHGGVPAGALAAAALGSAALVLAGVLLGVAAVALALNHRTALSIVGVVASPAVGYAGATFPLSHQPLAAQAWGEALPLTHALRLTVDQLQLGLGASAALPALLCLLGLALAALLPLGRLARACGEPDSWGRP